MTIRTLALLSLILSLPPSLAAAAEPATPNAGAGVPAGFSESASPAGSAEPDVWPDHAVPDADAARQGRSALPFTQGQIETLGRLLRQTQRASARGRGRRRKAVSGGSVSMGRAMGKSRSSRSGAVIPLCSPSPA